MLLILLPFFQRVVREIPLVVGRTEPQLLKKTQQLLNFKHSGEGPMLGKYSTAELQVCPFKKKMFHALNIQLFSVKVVLISN